jgi:hypothetical protein
MLCARWANRTRQRALHTAVRKQLHAPYLQGASLIVTTSFVTTVLLQSLYLEESTLAVPEDGQLSHHGIQVERPVLQVPA